MISDGLHWISSHAVYAIFWLAMWGVPLFFPFYLGHRLHKFDNEQGTVWRFFTIIGVIAACIVIFRLMVWFPRGGGDTRGVEGWVPMLLGIATVPVLIGYGMAWGWNKLGFSK